MFKKNNKHWAKWATLSLLLLCPIGAMADRLAAGEPTEVKQDNTTRFVKGVVTDDQGEPIIGATVVVKNDRKKGAATDLNGRFNITVPKTTKALTVSYVGMDNYDIILKAGKDMYEVVMKSNTELEEVVVTGLVNKRKESFTGSSATFSQEDLKAVSAQNAIASLKTLDPSFNVFDNLEFGSDPNKMPDIEIRGKSSLISTRDELAEDPNQPLFILDGFESTLETIYNLDMNRIASITILKDAASTAIYGSKAANGVVVVETVQPKVGKLDLNYNGNAIVSWADLTSYNLMNAREKLEFERLVGRYKSSDLDREEVLLESYNSKLADINRGVDTYWLSEPLRMGINHRHSVSAAGGQGAFRFNIGASYNGITGVMKESVRNNFSGNIDLTYRVSKIQFTNKFHMDDTMSSDPIVAFSAYANANPYYTKRNEDGEVDRWLEHNKYIEAANPLYNAAQNSYSKSGSISFSDKLIVEYTPIKALKLRGRVGITHTKGNNERFRSPKDTQFSKVDYSKRGSYSHDESVTNKYEAEFTLTYAQVLKKVHRVNLSSGGYLSQSDRKGYGYSAIGFPVGDFTLPSFANAYPDGGYPSYSESTNRSVSAYLIGNYSYKDRYLLDLSYRVNGASVFGTNRHYTGTWAVGLAWNLHHEKFIEDHFDHITMMKIRASVGNPGNQNFSSTYTTTTFRYNFNMYNYFGLTSSMNQLGNADLKWQTTLDRNIGFDVTMFNNRLTLVGDYFYKTTDPLLIGINMPPSAGATGNVMYKNFGKQTSKGYTFQATYYIIRKMRERTWWSVRTTLRHSSQTLSEIGNRLEMFNNEQREVNNSTKRYYDGADLDDIWAVRSAGIDPATGRELFYNRKGELTYDFSADDEVIVGNTRPKIEGTIGNTVSWKGFSANFDFRYRVGGRSFNSVLFNKVENIGTSSLVYNQDRRALYDRWQKPGDHAQFKDIANSSGTPMSSRFVQKENTLSLESIRVGYEFSPEASSALGMGSIRLNAYMNDIFRLSTLKQERGTSYPFARSITFSVALTL